MAFRIYKLSDLVLSRIGALSLSPDQVRDMARRSAPITHDLGNRRYEGFVFFIDGNEVVEINLINAKYDALECSICFGSKTVVMYDECDLCEGSGHSNIGQTEVCKTCNGEGLVKVSRPCHYALDPDSGMCQG